MAYEYIQVEFDEQRNVLCDGEELGPTHQALYVSPGFHTFTLDGDQNYTPDEHTIKVENTTVDEPVIIKFKKIVTMMLAGFLTLACGGCAHRHVNREITTIDSKTGYRLKHTATDAVNTDEVVLVVALSGGGTRAAALSYCALEEFADTTITVNGTHKSLLDEFDINSPVSGGSFTGAYNALHGQPPWSEIEDN